MVYVPISSFYWYNLILILFLVTIILTFYCKSSIIILKLKNKKVMYKKGCKNYEKRSNY